MRKYWDRMFGLNYDRSIWIDSEDLGKEKDIKHKHKHYLVKIPESINEKIILRLKGLGKTKNNETGDLLLHIRLNKGADLRKDLWLSETSAKDGANKILGLDSKRIRITIPPKSYHGLIIRLRGLGELLRFNWRYPFLQRKRGDLLVKLFVYPDKITPKYGSFDTLETDEMALEGWIYRRIDQVVSKIPKSSFPINPVQADTVAAQFNETGWKGVFSALVAHFGLKKLDIEINPSNSISLPGSCQKSIKYENEYPVGKKYTITINTKFIDNPFFAAAIMAHEICHVVYSEIFDNTPLTTIEGVKVGKILLEEERTVDLLVFLFKTGEFQLRVARDKDLTLGYFNQVIFERIQVIVSKKFCSTAE